MASYFFPVALDGSGNGTFDVEMHGELAAILADKTGIAANPTLTVAELQGMQQTVLNGVTVSATARYYPRVAVQDNAAAARLYAAGGTAVSDRYMLDGLVRVTIAGGDANETMNIWVQTY